MQTLVNVLAVAAILMTLLLGYFVILTIVRGVKSRAGLGERMPLWPGCPVAWLSIDKELFFNEKHVGWESPEWSKLIVENMPSGSPISPVVRAVSEGNFLLYLPARNRGISGWWVIKLSQEV